MRESYLKGYFDKRRNKTYIRIVVPIYKSRPVEISTGISVPPLAWSTDKGKLKNIMGYDGATEHNIRLKGYLSQIDDWRLARIREQGMHPSKEQVKEYGKEILGKNVLVHPSILNFLNSEIERMKEDRTVSASSIRRLR
ncbi:MAG: hypothetical protein AAF990_09920, partial [Bacteroidota bacterium]